MPHGKNPTVSTTPRMVRSTNGLTGGVRAQGSAPRSYGHRHGTASRCLSPRHTLNEACEGGTRKGHGSFLSLLK